MGRRREECELWSPFQCQLQVINHVFTPLLHHQIFKAVRVSRNSKVYVRMGILGLLGFCVTFVWVV